MPEAQQGVCSPIWPRAKACLSSALLTGPCRSPTHSKPVSSHLLLLKGRREAKAGLARALQGLWGQGPLVDPKHNLVSAQAYS